jgi:hypothetical protein
MFLAIKSSLSNFTFASLGSNTKAENNIKDPNIITNQKICGK